MSKSRGPGAGRKMKTLTAYDDMEALRRSLQKSLGGPRMRFEGGAGDVYYACRSRPRQVASSQMNGKNH